LVVDAVNRTQHNLMSDLSARTGMPAPWYDVLVRLRDAPDHRLPMNSLSMDITMTSGGFTKLADRLEEAGYLRRVPSEDDRRVVYLELTREGKAVVDDAMSMHVNNLRERVLAELPETAIRDVRDSLRPLHDAAVAS
jgi:DNA-binding MarR family transcriptional regulator